MGADSKIEWTHHTFNPWWGCARVSPGCEHCYAEAFAKRVGRAKWGVNEDRVVTSDKNWREPLKWNAAAEKAGERHRVFCASMADVFESKSELAHWREALWDLIEKTPRLDWLLLTKRPENVASLAPWGLNWPRNVWLGTTVEDQKRAEERIPILLRIPAAVRFLSCEPLLGPLTLRDYMLPKSAGIGCWHGGHLHPWEPGERCPPSLDGQPGRIDWVIVGGESGPGSRPMHPDWARSLRDQCASAGVAFHFKQWGQWSEIDYNRESPPGDRQGERYLNLAGGHGFQGKQVVRIRTGHKKENGRLLDGRTWDEFPEVRS